MNTQDKFPMPTVEEFERMLNVTSILPISEDEPLTEEEREAVEALRLARENYDEKADLKERIERKLQLQAENPGLVVEFDPDEAEHLGLFIEDAMSEEDAWASRFDGDIGYENEQ